MAHLSKHMSGDHERCDTLFARAEAAAEQADWNACRTLARQFRDAVLAHFDTEEAAIFPAFEARTGMTEGPTRVMRSEHVQMRELMERLEQAADAADAAAFGDAAETLLILMQQHNMKEENILYPMCDQAIGDDAQVAAAVQSLISGERNE